MKKNYLILIFIFLVIIASFNCIANKASENSRFKKTFLQWVKSFFFNSAIISITEFQKAHLEQIENLHYNDYQKSIVENQMSSDYKKATSELSRS